jgi:hypothetical protein
VERRWWRSREGIFVSSRDVSLVLLMEDFVENGERPIQKRLDQLESVAIRTLLEPSTFLRYLLPSSPVDVTLRRGGDSDAINHHRECVRSAVSLSESTSQAKMFPHKQRYHLVPCNCRRVVSQADNGAGNSMRPGPRSFVKTSYIPEPCMNLTIGWLGVSVLQPGRGSNRQGRLTGNRALGCILVVRRVDACDRSSKVCQRSTTMELTEAIEWSSMLAVCRNIVICWTL